MDYLEEVWAGTLAGTTIDKKIEFVFGGGIKPTFELIDSKDKSEREIQEELKKYDDWLDQLKEIDTKPDINFNAKAKSAAIMAKVFGRSVLAFEPEQGETEQLKLIHTRDLGRPEMISPTDWRLKSVIANGTPLMAEEMIYLENMPDSPVRRSKFYGYSELQRVLGLARALDRIVRFDAPEIAHSMWASYGLIVVNTDGKTEADARTQIETILAGFKPGAFNAISGKPGEDIQYIPMDLEAKVADLVSLVSMYERMIVGNSGVPGPMLGREEDSNMATLFGKIRLFLTGPVASDREWLSGIFSKQWYERNLKLLPGGEAILSKVRVKAEFEPITIESWVDLMPALVQLEQAIPGFPDNAKLTLAGLEQFKDDLEEGQQEKQKEDEAMAEERRERFEVMQQQMNKPKPEEPPNQEEEEPPKEEPEEEEGEEE